MTAVNLGGLHMMRRMAMHDSDALIDQLMNKAGLLVADAVVPARSVAKLQHCALFCVFVLRWRSPVICSHRGLALILRTLCRLAK